MHGGGSPGAPKGERHGKWEHGLRSAEVVEARRAMRALMRQLREEIKALGAAGSVR
jgi:isopentenyl phosphate kinase